MKIIVVTMSRFPEPNALTTHITLVSKVFLEKGNQVCVCGRGSMDNGEHDGVCFKSLKSKGARVFSAVWDYCFSFSHKVIREIEKQKPEVVLFYGGPTKLLDKLISKSRRGDFLLLSDCMEWYSKEQFDPWKREIIDYYRCDYYMRKKLPRNSSILAISQYLKDYFVSKGNDCAYLPAICDTNAVACAKKIDEKKVVVLYAGSPVKKDLFEPIVKAISELSTGEREKLQLEIVGSNASTIAENANVSVEFIESLGDCVTFLPRMPHSDVLKRLEKADFTILIRPEEMRYAKAGFPTKVPESLSTGTPVICNLTSDLAMYLEDGVNSIIAKGHSTSDVKEALERAIALSLDERKAMYVNARKTAETRFDYRLYVEQINEFVEKSYEKMKKEQSGQEH